LPYFGRTAGCGALSAAAPPSPPRRYPSWTRRQLHGAAFTLSGVKGTPFQNGSKDHQHRAEKIAGGDAGARAGVDEGVEQPRAGPADAGSNRIEKGDGGGADFQRGRSRSR
jgi:hypothetical protein